MAQPAQPPDWQTLAADLFAVHSEPVIAQLARANPSADRELIHDAFVDAVLQISQAFDRFDPERGTIAVFLRGAAQRRLRHLCRSDARRRRREQKTAADRVADEPSAARSLVDRLADGELAQKARDLVARTEEERQVLRLWELGVEEIGVYARALGIEDKPEPEQRARVKTIRDRLTQRLRRSRDGFTDQEEPGR